MQKKIKILGLTLSSIGLFLYAVVENEYHMQSEHITRVQGAEFSHIMSSSKHQQNLYKVDGQLVDSHEFYQRLDSALYQDMLHEREKELQSRQKKLDTLQKLRMQGLKKLIYTITEKAQKYMNILEQRSLQPHYAYKQETIVSRATLDWVADFLQAVQDRAEELYDHNAEDDLQYVLQQVEQLPERLEQFFQETVQHAIEHCDDTKLLKELLALLNQDFSG